MSHKQKKVVFIFINYCEFNQLLNKLHKTISKTLLVSSHLVSEIVSSTLCSLFNTQFEDS